MDIIPKSVTFSLTLNMYYTDIERSQVKPKNNHNLVLTWRDIICHKQWLYPFLVGHWGVQMVKMKTIPGFLLMRIVRIWLWNCIFKKWWALLGVKDEVDYKILLFLWFNFSPWSTKIFQIHSITYSYSVRQGKALMILKLFQLHSKVGSNVQKVLKKRCNSYKQSCNSSLAPGPQLTPKKMLGHFLLIWYFSPCNFFMIFVLTGIVLKSR